MKKLPIIALLAALTLAALPACNSDNKDQELLNSYSQWYEDNANWLKEQQVRKNHDGTPYFKTLVPKWDPNAFVLIHYFNDTTLTRGNLSPLYTSLVSTRYHLEYFNGAPIDSSYLLTAYGPGVFRCRPCEVIDGWAIALEDMHVGDTAEVVIPFQQAYGTSTSSSVPPFSNLKYNMSLVGIDDYEKNPY